MITYPSTHGVFEAPIKTICKAIHDAGGQVYMDGANMNAQVGLTSPGHISAPTSATSTCTRPSAFRTAAAAPAWARSAWRPPRSVPPQPVLSSTCTPTPRPPHGRRQRRPVGQRQHPRHLLDVHPHDGPRRLTRATQFAILNANYIAKRLEAHFPVLYKGATGSSPMSASSSLRPWKQHGLEVEDVAKRLMDYGYHAPTMSFPVPGTLMIEPTESESKTELDRFCDVLASIHGEMAAVASGASDKLNNPLKHAPHTASPP
jgi:glycine dehydrogenase